MTPILVATSHDLMHLCVSMFTVERDAARQMVDWLLPRGNTPQILYTLEGVQEELDEMISEGEDPTDEFVRAYQALAEFMRSNGATDLVLTK